jgi:hypothetical protein
MDCRPVNSRACTPTSDDVLEWVVTVECEDGTSREVIVAVGAVAHGVVSQLVTAVKESNGESAVLGALAADPTRVPTRVVCSVEGCQPQYTD